MHEIIQDDIFVPNKALLKFRAPARPCKDRLEGIGIGQDAQRLLVTVGPVRLSIFDDDLREASQYVDAPTTVPGVVNGAVLDPRDIEKLIGSRVVIVMLVEHVL